MARRSQSKSQSSNLIDQRTQQVLHGIIDNFISNTEPVGSRTLSKTLGLKLSPATIRNIMSDLSDLGYLTQSHTSGGRIPTDKAYRSLEEEEHWKHACTKGPNSLESPPSLSSLSPCASSGSNL